MEKVLDILVVEDSSQHQESARQLLGDHNLKVVGAFDEANLLINPSPITDRKPEHYDVLLTDLFFPYGRSNDLANKYLAEDPEPLGFALSLIAAQKGIPYIGMLTDLNHHLHPIANAFDSFDRDSNCGRVPWYLNNSKFLAFDIRDLPRLRITDEGKVVSLDELSEFKMRNVKVTNDSDIKNWSVALDRLLKTE